MSFKISVPRTNYIKNTRVEIGPTGVNNGLDPDRNKNVSDREAAASFGPSIGPPVTRVAGDRFSGGLAEAPPKEASKEVYKEVPNEKSYTKVEDNGVLKPDKYDINKNCLKYEQESVDYDILKLLKHDNQHVTNSFDLIKDIDDCGKINEIFNKMFCNIDNNTLRDQLSESLKNKKKVDPVFINKFYEVVDVDLREDGFSFFSNKKESPKHKDLSAVDPVKTGFFDVDQLVARRVLQSSLPTGGESEANKKISFPESGPIRNGLFELTHYGKGIELNDRGAAAAEGGDSRGGAVGDRFSGAVGDCEAAACDPCNGRADTRTEGGDRFSGAVGDRGAAAEKPAGSAVGNCRADSFDSDRSAAASSAHDEVVNTKVLGTEGVNIKKKNPRRKKNKKNKRM